MAAASQRGRRQSQSVGLCSRTRASATARGLRTTLRSSAISGARFCTPASIRRAGDFGVYDAPEPWGPWTTVFYTDEWDVGPGETSSFPTKWMSADGKTLHLVFSGDDHFSVRQ